MKKRFLILLMLSFLVACSNSGEETKGKQSENDDQANEETGETSLAIEVLYSYDHEESRDYSLQGIKTDSEGSAVVFTAKEDIDRKKDYYTYFIDRNDQVIEALELANDPDQERRCVDLNLSPDGKYLLYDCHDDGIHFSIYDLEEEETTHQIPEDDSLNRDDILGVSNDLTVYFETENDDWEKQLTFYDVQTKTTQDYVLDDLLGTEHASISKIIPTDDGKQILIDTVVELYLFDTETGDVRKIEDVEPYQEEFDNNNLFIYNARLSPDGKYLYYSISENSSDPVYKEYFFHNLESGEVRVYGELDYSVRNFDIHGNLLLEGDENLYLYNFDREETKIIPEIEVGVYSGYFTLTHNGQFIIYTDKERNDDNYTTYLYRVSLGDINTYETTSFEAQEERAREEVGQDEIALSDASFEESDLFLELWDSSTSVMFPTEFPETVTDKTNHYSGDPSKGRYSQTIYVDTTSHKREEINFTTSKIDEGDTCPLLRDLEVVETKNGNDYYFHAYQNSDVEAGVLIDNVCYFIDAEDYTQDEMLSIVQSLEPIDTAFHELKMDGLKFPKKFPIGEPETRNPRVISYRDGETVDYLIDYRGDGENDIKMDLEIRNSEPKLYMNENTGFEVEVDGWEEAYFLEDRMNLHLYDGTYYYIIKLDISNDMLEAFGKDHVTETFIEIGESMK
ncbi:PD40 domain-containing protein [Ornithinibacillus massiliensis]|uniref:PD40 domain-containing protein n=1 Tax=Ornithinibacillus massiliensis TaxID=1944633 RepID=A0ABS5MIV2_9BACI|nr:PD40 domain-containing protein [Ornithinibacillus massiliensis]MBS3682271.1 PD40 domain-containing protein [Ornithinibacillus massiliensis]